VLDGDRPLALLPLVARSRRRWASSWQGASRLRHRPVLGTQQPEQEPLGLLADEVARTGVRELTLRLPARDPATAAMATALGQAGFHVHQRQWSGEYLALVEGGWAGFSQRFAGCQRSARKLARRLRPLWEVTLDEYGPGTGVPVADGYAIYADLYSRSWKPPLSDHWERYELELLRRTEALGWARIYVLRVAGVPAAAQLWCRLGDVAISIGTVYDRRMAAISPGTMSEWPVRSGCSPAHRRAWSTISQGPPISSRSGWARTGPRWSASRRLAARSSRAPPSRCAASSAPSIRRRRQRGPSDDAWPRACDHPPVASGPACAGWRSSTARRRCRWPRWSWTRRYGASSPSPAGTRAPRRWPGDGRRATPGGGSATGRRRSCGLAPAGARGGGRCARRCCWTRAP
jgi:Acetyltransferase (GNAT) domain